MSVMLDNSTWFIRSVWVICKEDDMLWANDLNIEDDRQELWPLDLKRSGW